MHGHDEDDEDIEVRSKLSCSNLVRYLDTTDSFLAVAIQRRLNL
jgi:hypothetical protein